MLAHVVLPVGGNIVKPCYVEAYPIRRFHIKRFVRVDASPTNSWVSAIEEHEKRGCVTLGSVLLDVRNVRNARAPACVKARALWRQRIVTLRTDRSASALVPL